MCQLHLDLSISDREVRRFRMAAPLMLQHSTKTAPQDRDYWPAESHWYKGVRALIFYWLNTALRFDYPFGRREKDNLIPLKQAFAILFKKNFCCCVLLHSHIMCFLEFPILPKSLQLFCYSDIANRGEFISVFSVVLFLRHGLSQAVFWNAWESFDISEKSVL